MKKERTLSYWSVLAIGIGGMVGGGIFAVLGLAVQLGHGGTPIAFALAGLIALLTAYSYSRLSVRYPSRGGTVEFINQGFGTGFFTGGLNILLWISYIIMLSLYAYAFGSYGASFFPESSQEIWRHILTTVSVLLFTGINVIGVSAIGKAEKWIVGAKLTILIFFISIGIWSINLGNMQPGTWTGIPELVAGGMIIFLAYEGFELIANAAEDVENPKKTLPRAYYTSVIFVIILYVLISIVTIGNLNISSIVGAKDYALAAAARPFLGHFGFVLIAFAALLSTGSAINATLYGTARVSYIIAKDGELPKKLEKKVWNRPIEGLLITAGITVVVANLLDITSISVIGSAGFLLIFAAVNASNAICYRETGCNRWIAISGLLLCIIAFFVLLWQRLSVAPYEIIILIAMISMAFIIEGFYRKTTGRKIKSVFHRSINR